MKITTVIFITLSLLSCNWVKKEGTKIVDKSKSKIKEVWSKTIDEALSSNGSFESTNFEKSFGEIHDPEIVNIEGIKNNRLLSFHEGFVLYEGKKEDVLDHFAELKSSKPELSDNGFENSDTVYLSKRIRDIEANEPDLNNEIEFFKNFSDISNPLIYTINKYPLSHTILFDDRSNKVYHYYENYID